MNEPVAPDELTEADEGAAAAATKSRMNLLSAFVILTVGSKDPLTETFPVDKLTSASTTGNFPPGCFLFRFGDDGCDRDSDDVRFEGASMWGTERRGSDCGILGNAFLFLAWSTGVEFVDLDSDDTDCERMGELFTVPFTGNLVAGEAARSRDDAAAAEESSTPTLWEVAIRQPRGPPAGGVCSNSAM